MSKDRFAQRNISVKAVGKLEGDRKCSLCRGRFDGGVCITAPPAENYHLICTVCLAAMRKAVAS